MVAYGLLGAAALALGVRPGTSDTCSAAVLVGALVAIGGYPLGRRLVGDAPDKPPPDSLRLELLVLGLVVVVAEEAIWGWLVEPIVGIPATAALFAIKHPLVDGRWRRTGGLFLFWLGLGLVRTAGWPFALAIHLTLNTTGVVIGHRRGLDQF